MNAHERRQYEMLLRVEDFGKTQRYLFSASSAPQTFAAVTAAIAELNTTALLKATASASARVGRKKDARKALTDLMVRVGTLARVLRARGEALPAFDLPASRSDQALLVAARQFARDAALNEGEFSGHGMGPDVIAAAADTFETAARDRGMSRAERTGATTRIHELLASALMDVRRLDLMVRNELAGDPVVQALWKQARRIQTMGNEGTPTSAEATVGKPETKDADIQAA